MDVKAANQMKTRRESKSTVSDSDTTAVPAIVDPASFHGFDDVAVRRREVTQVSKRRQETDDSTTIYRSENGKLVGHPVTDSTERTNINAELCSDSELSFCH
jgi:hypothetical protein